MRSFYWQACLASVLVGALATSSIAATRTTELDRTAQISLGLATATLATRDVPQSIDVAIAVLDPAPLAKLADELIASHAAVNASTAESQRSEALLKADGNISRKNAEAARAQAAADQAHWRQLRSQLRLEWGDALASMDDASLQQVVKSVVGGRVVLIRAQPLTLGGRPGSPRRRASLCRMAPLCRRVCLGRCQAASRAWEGTGYSRRRATSSFPAWL